MLSDLMHELEDPLKPAPGIGNGCALIVDPPCQFNGASDKRRQSEAYPLTAGKEVRARILKKLVHSHRQPG